MRMIHCKFHVSTFLVTPAILAGLTAPDSMAQMTHIEILRVLESTACQELLEVHNIGDIGSIVGGAPSDERDGADEFLLVEDPDDDPRISIVTIRDGWTGAPLWDVAIPSGFDGALVGFDATGGKNIVGDVYPDFVLSAAFHQGGDGHVLVYDGHQPDQPPVVTAVPRGLPDFETVGFGQAVEVIGDLTLDGYSEIAVGDFGFRDLNDPNWPAHNPGAVIILDVNQFDPAQHYVLRTIPRPVHDLTMFPNQGHNRFAFDIQFVGDPYDSTNFLPTRQWGNDSIGEFAACEPYWRTNVINSGLQGMWAMFTNDLNQSDPIVQLDTNPSPPYLFRGATFDLDVAIGFYCSGTVDCNNDSGAGFREYDVLVSSAFHGSTSVYSAFPGALGGGTDSFELHGASGFFHPNYTQTTAESQLQARSGVAIGDINLDGYDDFAVVTAPDGHSFVCQTRHGVAVYSGQRVGGVAPFLDELTEWDGFPLFGVCEELVGEYDFQCTTTVNRLGDVDLDGLNEFAVVTGANTMGPTHSEISLLMIIGSASSYARAPLPVPPPDTPVVRRNFYVPVDPGAIHSGSVRVAIRIENCSPGGEVDLYEGQPQSPTMTCGGWLKVNDPDGPITLTPNADGVATYLDFRDDDDVTIGSQVYFQALHRFNGPPAGCKISNVHSLTYVASCDPYQVLSHKVK